MQEKLVSVIVPVYNIEDYLPRCLACIEMQTYRNLEIILVDDGSTDGSGRICDEFVSKDSRARVIHHSKNIGTWAARNTGQGAAHGDFIWFPDGDDYFHKDIIKVMLEAINKRDSSGHQFDLAIVGHKKTFRFDEDISSEIIPSVVERPLDFALEVFVRPKGIYSGRELWSKLCRNTLIKDIRAGNYKYAEDCDFSLKMYSKSPRIVCVDNVLYYYVRRNTSASFSQDYIVLSTWCSVDLLYDNYQSNKVSLGRRRHFILEPLYNCMAKLLDYVQGTDSLRKVREECKTIVHFTWKSYMRCSSIKTPIFRFKRLFRVRFDRLYRKYLNTNRIV